jgi:hypothetical protein
MGDVVPLPIGPSSALPTHGGVFYDVRGDGRTLRVNWHGAERMVVLSLWRDSECTATFRLPAADLPDLLRALTDGPIHDRP